MGRVVCLTEAESWRAEHQVFEAKDELEKEEHDHDIAMDGDKPESLRRDKGKTPLRGPFVPTAEEIHEAFDWIKSIRYNQPLHLGGERI